MKFTKEFLQESIDDTENTVQDIIIDHSRWSVTHHRIFKHEGKFYETFYSVGATENQDEAPYEWADNEIECAEVQPVETMIVVYKPVEVK